MDSRTLSRMDRGGRAGRLAAAAGAALAVAAGASALAQPAQSDQPGRRLDGASQRTTTTQYYTDDAAWRDHRSYGEVNYPEDMDYGDFAYYSDYPPGRYDNLGSRRTLDRYGYQPVQRRDPYASDYDSRVHRAGMYEQGMVRGGRDLPRTNVVIHDMSLGSEQWRGAPRTAQTARFEEPRRARESVGARPAPEPMRRVERRGYVSYGDVNYEQDPGYGEFSYYGEEPGESRRFGETRRYETTPARYQPAGGSGAYYTEDWDEGRSDFDRWYDRSR